ncbi:6221_t:CDS:2, partial [Paraglomus brasilianum]
KLTSQSEDRRSPTSLRTFDHDSLEREAIGLLFNAAKVLAEQSVHFVDGWVHLNMENMLVGNTETEEEIHPIEETLLTNGFLLR